MTGTLVIGSGFVGTGVARRLCAAGSPVTLASRGRPTTPPAGYGARWCALDATDTEACGRLLAQVRPERVVLVHGPSDVTWCEAHPAEAERAHVAVADNVASLAPDARIVLISTDNVFDGAAPRNTESTPVSPANAYGRAKRRAEEVLLGTAADAVALRVSLVYGHEPADAGKWLNFFAACAHRLLAGEPVRAPDDHWTTPVAVDDVARVTAALLDAAAPLPPVLHLGGPDRVTRAEWAMTIADALGADRQLVEPVPKARTRYASRPRNACLASELTATLPGLAGLRVRGIDAAARALAADFGPVTRPPAPARDRG
ncbi:sugar nucleotide-binding protein [Streptomyces sp. VRA16 Mangrove soil]|uniref:SDR family oxidoreductase n=1 Tax=Streptomyces sp. VRA16 Mangrove soil TaxID=2817434 RepID=UPI001A9DAB9F|nr:sugar nucleotide-binding protein [Streptomyces sp. VRA16 Mangrove soil]MBO1334474.1 sugar nucleotide-binding protein [Streptomyces sp. VRA16 Mangrove soil]